jgi:hypothetical protein
VTVPTSQRKFGLTSIYLDAFPAPADTTQYNWDVPHICRGFEGSDFALQVAYGPGNRKAPSADQYNFPPRQDHRNSFLIPTDIRSSNRERTGVPHGRVNYLAVHKSFDFRGGSLGLNYSIHDPVTIEA